MIKLNVGLTFPDGQRVHAGELVVADPDARGRLRGAFRYTDAFLHHSRRFSLDPAHLPLRAGEFDPDRDRQGVHAVFEDALPGAWGTKLLIRRFLVPRHEQRVPHLLALLGSGGLGALSFSQPHERPQRHAAVDTVSLPALLDAAARFEKGETVDDEPLALLLRAGSTSGGMRPKVIVADGDVLWIAKLPSVHDDFDAVAIEAATLSLAGKAGILVPPFEVRHYGSRKALLVRRFDVTSQEGRRHMISLQALLGAEGHYNESYESVAEALRRFSDDPAQDPKRLYRQMLFNILVGNTDDHLKNFTLLHDDEGWQLSPAYDLIPNIAQVPEHVLSVAYRNRGWKRDKLVAAARSFGFGRRKNAEQTIDAVAEAVVCWKEEYRNWGVPDTDIRRLAREIDRNLQAVCT